MTVSILAVRPTISSFFKEETCGKCTTCEEGVKKMCELVGEIQDRATRENLALLGAWRSR